MSVGAELRNLGRYLDRCEQMGSVSTVSLNDGSGVLAADVTLDLSLAPTQDHGSALAISDVTVDSAGKLKISLASERGVLPEPPDEIDIEVTETAFAAGGTLTVQLSVAIGNAVSSGHGDNEKNDDASTDTSAAIENRDIPPFRDTELLAEIYASCDTFAEMTAELGMDVTAETVRRYMIEHGIHEPTSYDTTSGSQESVSASDGPDTIEEEPDQPKVVIADGIGLPDNVTVETLIETVKRSNTIFEVKQEMGLERQDALEMLQELNLLDLVMGRLADESAKNITRDEIIDRLREASVTA